MSKKKETEAAEAVESGPLTGEQDETVLEAETIDPVEEAPAEIAEGVAEVQDALTAAQAKGFIGEPPVQEGK